jgi:hypothetical protein
MKTHSLLQSGSGKGGRASTRVAPMLITPGDSQPVLCCSKACVLVPTVKVGATSPHSEMGGDKGELLDGCEYWSCHQKSALLPAIHLLLSVTIGPCCNFHGYDTSFGSSMAS